ncbi:helix-turn-helix domain-containing protein [Streptomyces sp. PmtG]
MVTATHREGGQALFVPPRAPTTARTPGPAPGLAPVLAWASRRIHKPLTIGQRADRTAMSTRTFSHHSARETGLTPLRWLIRQRLARARELPEATGPPIDAIAERTGFSACTGTGTVLRRHFHRRLGTTPTAGRWMFGPGRPPLATAARSPIGP